jgi:hypothetical protein
MSDNFYQEPQLKVQSQRLRYQLGFVLLVQVAKQIGVA